MLPIVGILRLQLSLCQVSMGHPQSIEVLKGTVERVTFHDEESGYAVLKVSAGKRMEPLTVTGRVASVQPGEGIEAQGEWVNNAQYGRQFKASSIHTIEPDSVVGIERYLGSGLIDGIGPAYAKRLVKKFGKEVFDIIDHASARLEEVDGIGTKRRKEIKAAWENQKRVREIMVFLHEHGLGTGRAVRIYQTYGDDSVRLIEENPYRLAEDIYGIGFKTSDTMAQSMGIAVDAEERVRAGIFHALKSASDDGHCCLPVNVLTERAIELLQVQGERVTVVMGQLTGKGDLVVESIDDEAVVFLPALHHAEKSVAARLRSLASRAAEHPVIEVDRAVAWAEQRSTMTFAASQRQAIGEALRHRVLVITGGPGVGKTTIVNAILEILAAKDVRISLAAPTGRAAKRMTETTGRDALTIHRLLEYQPSQGFAKKQGSPLKGDFFVLDETSMVDVRLMFHFLDALPPEAHLLLVGDTDQLPSVGPGNVLGDTIASGTVPVVRLTEIFRQASESQIITAAHAINAGHLPPLENLRGAASDFYFAECEDPDQTIKTIVRLVRDRIPDKFGFDPIRDVQVLSPMNRSHLGTSNLNAILQAALNPPSELKYEVERFGQKFRVGDKVIQMRNNYDKEVFNGDIGRISEIETEPVRVVIRFDDGRRAVYEPGELDEIRLAYAITIHKSQGSEFSAVIIPMSNQHYVMLQRNLLYTGLTRGKKLVVLVGERRAISLAVSNCASKRRWSGLLSRLRESREGQ
ncbi:MAG: exodeoxyribonuclease V alpha subunit [Verrucomicrobiales bacterium]|jgi:exodeoxyribonuclease V alpha subunit